MGFFDWVGDLISDVIDTVVDVVDTVIGWVVPTIDMPNVPTYSSGDNNGKVERQIGQLQSIKLNKQSANTQIPVVYGVRKVGGTFVYLETNSGGDNEFLYGALVLSEGQVDGLLQVYIDDRLVNFSNTFNFTNLPKALEFDGDAGASITSPFTHAKIYTSNDDHFADLVKIQFFDGRSDQTASSLLTQQDNWTSNHRLRGISYLAFKLEYSSDAFRGLPNIQVIMKGKKVVSYNASLEAQTASFSSNPAWCLLDYLTNDIYGKALPTSAIDLQSFYDASVICDTSVNPTDTGSVALKKYTLKDNSTVGLLSYRYLGFYHAEKLRKFRTKISKSNQAVFTTGNFPQNNLKSPSYNRNNQSFLVAGYFVAPATDNFFFKTDSVDSSLVYIGTSDMSISDLLRDIKQSQNYNSGTVSSYLAVDNSGEHTKQERESGAVALQSGSEYPIVIVCGNKDKTADVDFYWKQDGGSYSQDLSTNFIVEESDVKKETTVYTATTTPIFSINGVVDTSARVIDNVQHFLRTCRGFLPYSKGTYKLKIETTGTASITLTDDDIIGGIQVKQVSANERYNRVIANYCNPLNEFESDQSQFPPIDDNELPTADQYATMLADDNDKPLEGTFDFDFITNSYQAEEMAEVILRRSRNNLTVSLNATGEAMDLEVGDIVNITHTGMGFSAKPFRVQNINLNGDFTVSLVLQEYQASAYTWATKEPRADIPDTTLPNVFDINPPSFTSITDELIELQNGTIVSKIVLELASENFYREVFELRYREKNSGKPYQNLGTSTSGTYEIQPVEEGKTYEFIARVVSSIGAKSDYFDAQHTVVSAFLPPADITDYSIELSGDKLIHQWTPPTDLDLSHFVIKYSKKANETKFANGVVIADKIPATANRFVTPIFNDGTYMIRPVDLFGIPAENFDSVVLDFDSETQIFGKDFKAVQTITEEPNFTGTKTNTAVVESGLILGTGLFDDAEGDIDDALGLFDAGLGTVVASGSYEFDGFDFSNKFPFKLLLHDLDVIHLNYSDSFDATAGNFDAKEGTFDEASDATQENVIDCKLFVATSDDAVSYSAYKQFENGDFIARAVKFKAVLSSTNPTATPVVENLSIKIILPKLTQSDNDVASLSGADKVIDYDNAFYEKPQLTVTAEDMLSGDYFTVSNSDRTGFDISFYDSTNSRVIRNFSYNSIGIGQQQ